MLGTLLDGRFRIIELISEDDATRLYKARHELLARQALIKTFKTDLFGEEKSRQRFQRESRALSSLNHPRIVKIFDSGITPEGEPYLAMDFLEGEKLSSILSSNDALPPQRIVSIFSQACDALAHAHKHGVIHTALSPKSIILVGQQPDEIRITDFGIARLLSLDSPERLATQSAGRFSNPRYMSPEQCVGRDVDARSDVYSLACVIYEALTGNPPYSGDVAVEIVSQHISPQPVPSPAVTIDAPECKRLVPVVMKALKKDAGERYQSMREFQLEIDACLPDSRSAAEEKPAHSLLFARVSPKKLAGISVIPVILVLAVAFAAFWLSTTDEGRLQALRMELIGESALLPQSDPRCLKTAEELLSQCEKCRKYGEAVSVLKNILPSIESKHGAASPEVIQYKIRLIELLLYVGRVEEARRVQSEILALILQLQDPLRTSNRGKEAQALLEKYVQVFDLIPTPANPELARVLDTRANADLVNGVFEEALTRLLRSYKIRQVLTAQDPCLLGATMHQLAWAYEGEGDLDQAYKYLLKSWQIFARIQDYQNSYRIPVDLAVISRKKGRLAESEEWYREAYSRSQTSFLEFAPDFLVEILDGLGNTCRLEGKLSEAQSAIKEAIATESKIVRRTDASAYTTTLIKPPFASKLHCDLAAVYADAGKPELARKEYEVALKLAYSTKWKDGWLGNWFPQYPRYQRYSVLTTYAKFLERVHEPEQAESLMKRASLIVRKGPIEQPAWSESPLAKCR